jgi:hypothetical protein
MLKARLKRDQAPQEYLSALRDLLDKTNIHDVEGKCEQWVRSVVSTGGDAAWKLLCEALVDLYESKISAGAPAEPGVEVTERLEKLLFGGTSLTDNQAKRVYDRLSDATIGGMLSAVPRDQISMTYVDENGNNIKFEKASPGQQASALLELLLRQSAGTLIVDQPEDDLDNRVIMRIVELIRTSKNTRQLIFSTHNPNVVVNGDADKVLALRSSEGSNASDFPHIQVDRDGAIESHAIRIAITDLMEGGKDAFDLRRRKYRFDLSSSAV